MLKKLQVEYSQKVKKVRVLVSQFSFKDEDWSEKNDLFYAKTTIGLKEKIEQVVRTAINQSVNLIVFPESSIPVEYIPFLQQISKQNDLIIVCGSQYYEEKNKFISKSPIIINGSIYYTEKITPSPYEQSPFENKGLTNGSEILLFDNTQIGKFAVFICADYLNEDIRKEVLENDLDFVVIIAFQGDSHQYYSRINDNCEESKSGTYFIYSNIYLPNKSDGNSAIFGHLDRIFLEKISKAGFTDCNPPKKVFALKNLQNVDYLIAEFDIENKKPSFARFVHTIPNIKIIEYNKLDEITEKFNKLIGHSDIRYEKIDELFVEPNEFKSIQEKLEEYNIIFIVGDPGIGKTYTSVKLLKEYFQNGYKPVWFTGLEKEERKAQRIILDDFEIEDNSIIYFEDPFGRTTFERRDTLFTFLRPLIAKASKVNSKIIISSRKQIFEEFAEESLNKDDLSRFMEELNVIKPSYNSDDLLKIFRNYSSLLDLKADSASIELIKNKINRGQITTPFEIREIVLTAVQINDINQLKSIIESSKTDSIKTYAQEINGLAVTSQIVYILILFFGHLSLNQINQIFENYKLNKFYPEEINNSTFIELLKLLIGYRVERYGKFNEFLRFSHPKYEEAIHYYVVNYNEPKKIISNIYQTINKTRKRIRFYQKVSKFIFKFPKTAIEILKFMEIPDEDYGRYMLIPKMGNRLATASKMYSMNNSSFAEEFKGVSINFINILQLIKTANQTNNLYMLKEILKLLINYCENISNEPVSNYLEKLDYEKLLETLVKSKQYTAIIECLELFSFIDNKFMNKFIKKIKHLKILKLLSIVDIEKRLRFIELLEGYERVDELIRFVNKVKRKVLWSSILRIICQDTDPKNIIFIDKGAQDIFLLSYSDLLPVGIVKIEGEFDEGNPVLVSTLDGKIIGGGLSEYNSKDLAKIIGQHSSKIGTILGYTNGVKIIKRFNKLQYESFKNRWLPTD